MPVKTIMPRRCRVCETTLNLVRSNTKPCGLDTICYPCKRAHDNLAKHKLSPEQRQERREARARHKAKNYAHVLELQRAWHRTKTREPERVKVAKIIAKWRKANGATQKEMATLTGTSEFVWWKRENGRAPWPMDVLQKLRHAGCRLPDPIPPVVYQRTSKTLRGEP